MQPNWILIYFLSCISLASGLLIVSFVAKMSYNVLYVSEKNGGGVAAFN
jgi:hypothetical protein